MAQRLLAALLFLLIGCFYYWSVGQGHQIRLDSSHSDLYYNGLTDSLLAGRLSLPAEPNPVLATLADPYDPNQNGGLALHDASYYKGKYYLYLGITPVLLLFLPFRLLRIGDLPLSAAVAVFAFGSVAFWFLTLSLARRKCVPGGGRGALYATLLVLGFGGSMPFLLRRPAMYEVAIASGAFCVAAAVYFSVSAVFSQRGVYWRAGLASLFLGLAVGARPNLVFAVPLLWLVWKWRRDAGHTRLLTLAMSLALPWLAVLAMLAVYNYARFDSFTQFGNAYQLAGLDVRTQLMDTRRIPYFVYMYLWYPCRLDWVFPYVHALGGQYVTVPGFSSIEPVSGVLFTTPFLYVLAILPMLARSPGFQRDQGPAAERSRTLARLAWGIAGIGLTQIIFLSVVAGITMRYIGDFSGALITAAGLALLALEANRTSVPLLVMGVRAIVAPLLALTLAFNLAIGLTGYYDVLKGFNPAQYAAIQRTVDPVAFAIASRVLDEAEITSIEPPDGLRKTTEGVEFFWVNKDEARLHVFARRDGTARLRFHMTKGLNRPDLPDRRIRVATDEQFATVVTIDSDGEHTLAVPVHRGFNNVGIRVLDVPQAVPPRTGPEFAAVRLEEWSVSLAGRASE